MSTPIKTRPCCLTLPGLLLSLAIAATSVAALSEVAQAQVAWINPGSGDWDDDANWDTGTFPNAMDVDALFEPVFPLFDSTITLNAVDITVGTIQFNNSTNSTVTGRTITFNDSTSAEIQFNAGNWTIESDIVLDSNLTVKTENDGTLSGNIADGAATSLTKEGIATLTLTGNNTFSGTTQVNNGVLQLGGVGALGGTSALVVNADAIVRLSAAGDEINDVATVTLNDTSTFDLDGNFEQIGSLSGGANTMVTLGAATLDTGGNGGSTVYNGVISGTGDLFKRGGGTFSLNGANVYTGPTTVAGGRLNVNGSLTSDVTVNNGATFGGTGSVPSLTVNAGGTVAPGNSIGTMTINGAGTPAFTQAVGSTYAVEIGNAGAMPGDVLPPATTAGVDNDLINLTNAAATVSLAGNVNVQDTTGGGFYSAGTTYTVLQTANPNGVTGEMYDSVTDNIALRDAVLIHNNNSVQVQLQRIDGDFAANSGTRNQRAVGTVLDGVNALATGDLGVVLDQLVQLPNASKGRVLDQLSGELHASVTGLTVLTTSRFVDIVSDRLRANTSGAAGSYGATVPPGAPIMGSINEVGMERVSLSDADDFVVRAQGVGMPMYGAGYGNFGAFPGGLSLGSIWAGGYGLSGDVDTDGNANGYDYDQIGTAFGIEQQLTPMLLMGLVGGYSHAELDQSRMLGSADLDSWHAGVYAHVTEGIFYSSGLVSYGFQDYDTSRRIIFPGVNRRANAGYEGDELTAYIEKGLNLSWNGLRVQPLIGLQYLGLQRDGFQETGAGALNLTVNEDHVDSLRMSVGGRIAPELAAGYWGAILPEIRGRWVHEFLDDDQALSANFGGAPGSNFIVRSPELGRNFGIVGAGLNVQLSPMANLFLDYDYQFSSQLETHAGSGGLEFLW